MPKHLLFVTLFILLNSTTAYSQYDLFQSDHFDSERFNQIKKATVALVTKENIDSTSLLSFGNTYSFCSNQKFLEEKLWSNCSGVLISKDVVLTAGHCIHSDTECTDKIFVFDYKSNSDILRIQSIPSQSEYKCKKVLYWSQPIAKKNLVDYALIQLDRPVLDRKPIALSKNSLNRKQDIMAVGHPLGLPMKISVGFVSEKNANLNANSKNPFYSAEMLTHPGLSGGAVYDSEENLVGLLVRGEPNIESDDGRCHRAKTCDSASCPWAEIQRLPVEAIKKLIPN